MTSFFNKKGKRDTADRGTLQDIADRGTLQDTADRGTLQDTAAHKPADTGAHSPDPSRKPARKDNDLGNDPVVGLYFRLAAPALCAQLVNALYTIVDRIYIGHIPDIGALALTGLGICFPVLMFILAFCSLIGVGGSTRAAIAMGAGEDEKAKRILGNCTLTSIVAALLLMVVFELAQIPMLRLFGASDDTIGYASQYLSIYLVGTLFVFLATGLNTFISAQGFAIQSMCTVLIGAVLNIILDPIFIFVFGMGIAGAAIATVISQAISAAWVLRFLTGSRTRLPIQKKYLRLDSKILLPVLAIGISPFVMQATESLLNIAFNTSLERYGGDIAVGAMTIAASVGQLMGLTFQGFSQGAQPIMGYNFGAGKLERVRQAFYLLFGLCLGVSVLCWLACELRPDVVVAIFSDDAELASYACWALRIYMAAYVLMGVQSSCQQTFVALGQAKISLFLALLRKCILLIPLIYIIPCFCSDAVFGVFLAEPVADALAVATTAILFFRMFPKILASRAAALQTTAPQTTAPQV